MSAESTDKLTTNLLEVVDVLLNIQYDELVCLRAGRIASLLEGVRPASSSSLSFQFVKRVWDNSRIIST